MLGRAIGQPIQRVSGCYWLLLLSSHQDLRVTLVSLGSYIHLLRNVTVPTLIVCITHTMALLSLAVSPHSLIYHNRYRESLRVKIPTTATTKRREGTREERLWQRQSLVWVAETLPCHTAASPQLSRPSLQSILNFWFIQMYPIPLWSLQLYEKLPSSLSSSLLP